MPASRKPRKVTIKGRFAVGASLPPCERPAGTRYYNYSGSAGRADRPAAEYARVMGRAHVNRYSDAAWNSTAAAPSTIERIAA